MKRLVLVYQHPELGEQRFELETGNVYSLGSRPDNDIVIPQPDVSRRHAKLVVSRGGLQITDLGSKNGTWVGGRRVTTAAFRCGEPVMLSSASLVVMEVTAGSFAVAPEIEAPKMEAKPPRSSDTVQHVQETGPVELVKLLERTAESLERGGAAPILDWIADRPGIRGALVVVVGGGVRGVEGSAGEVEGLLSDSGGLEELVATVVDPTRSDPGESGGIAFREDTMGIRVDSRHVLLLALGGTPPADLEVRAVRAALRTVLAGAARSSGVRPAPAVTDADSGEEEDGEPAPGIVGSSPAFVSVLRRAVQFARHEEPVMILGESGTGKELLARLIHQRSARRREPFVAVNCAAMPADLIEAELFGVSRGAATGVGERPGKFQAADGGTFFLDEVGDIPLELQGKLLRVLEAGEYFRVGDDRPRRCNVRIVSATNRDLPTAVREGRFRADLFYRLHVFVLEVPPLRERRSDIPLLINHFLAKQGGRMGRRVRGVSVRALRALMAYDWPGNVRELRSEVTRILAAVVDGAVIDVHHLSKAIGTAGQAATEPADLERFTGMPLSEAVAEFERNVILRTLEECGGNRTRTAELLGLTRAGLFKKMRRLGLTPEGVDSSG